MNAIGLTELRELLHGASFAAWWTDLARADAALRDASVRRDDLAAQSELMEVRSELAQRAAVDTFSRAGAAEDEAAQAAAAAQVLENRALELVGRYEEQRRRTSELWVRLGGAEQAAERSREAVAAGGGSGRGRGRPRAQAAVAVGAAERQHAALEREYAAEDAKRAALWAEVEGAWAAGFERSLVAGERALHARRIRRDAERLFEQAEERRARAARLRTEAEAAARDVGAAAQRRAELLAAAERDLGCLAGESFLYWRHRDDERVALAVALADDPGGAHPAVKALDVHAVGRERGAAALEPPREGAGPPAAGARRLEGYLIGAGPGAKRRSEGEPPGGPTKP